MTDRLTRARTIETDAAADRWATLAYPSRDFTHKGLGPTELEYEAFAAGMAHAGTEARGVGVKMAGNAVGLLAEAAALFRTYTAHHVEKAQRALALDLRINDHPRADDSMAKANRNADIAARIEAFLIDPATPKDRIAGLALSLVQDLDGAEWPAGFEEDVRQSFIRLRDALDGVALPGQMSAAGQAKQERVVSAMAGVVEAIDEAADAELDPVYAAKAAGWDIKYKYRLGGESYYAKPSRLGYTLGEWRPARGISIGSVYQWRAPGSPSDDRLYLHMGSEFMSDVEVRIATLDSVLPEQGETDPMLTLTVNGVTFVTHSKDVEGYIGGCPIKVMWDGKTDIRIDLDKPFSAISRDAIDLTGTGLNEAAARATPVPAQRTSNLRQPDPIAFADAAGLADAARPKVDAGPGMVPIRTGDPRFNPVEPVTVNGYPYYPAGVIESAKGLLAECAEMLNRLEPLARAGDQD